MNYFEMKWRLSACRIQAGYSQAEVAEILGCSDKTIVIVPILSEGIVVEKTQYVSREKWSREDDLPEDDQWAFQANERRD